MSRLLKDLDYRFINKAKEFLALLTEAGIPVMIVNTRRTAEEQAENVAKGVSWTKYSKHQDGLAIDICPYDQYQLHGPDKLQWDDKDPIWQRIGEIGQSIGLKWGVVIDGKRKDLGHFEYVGLGDKMQGDFRERIT